MLWSITGNRYNITLLWRGMALQYSYTNIGTTFTLLHVVMST